MTLPTGASTPLPDAAPVREALAHCGKAEPVTAEIGLSGSAAGQRLRGTLHAGFAPPDALRLEAVAPFGGPVFLLAGRGGSATLLLPREDRVLRDAAPGAILEAIAGLDVSPADLRAWVVGCPGESAGAASARGYGGDWVAADLAQGRTAWVSRTTGAWRLAAMTAGPLTVEFADHVDAHPGRLRIRRAEGPGAAALDIRLGLAQVERGVPLPDAAFTLEIPADAVPITIDDLRASGPLRDRDTKNSQ
jgi:hypothetical protein